MPLTSQRLFASAGLQGTPGAIDNRGADTSSLRAASVTGQARERLFNASYRAIDEIGSAEEARARAVAGLGDAFAQAGAALGQLRDTMRAKEEAQEFNIQRAGIRASYRVGGEKIHRDLDAREGYLRGEGYREAFADSEAELVEGLTAGIDDDNRRALILADLEDLRATQSIAAQRLGTQRQSEWSRGQLTVALETLGGAAAGASTVPELLGLVEDGLTAIDDQVGLSLTPPEAEAKKITFRGVAVEKFIDTHIASMPRLTLDGLRGGAFDALGDAEQIAGWTAKAERAWTSQTAAERERLKGLAVDHLASIEQTGTGIPGIRSRMAQVSPPEALVAFDESVADAMAFNQAVRAIEDLPIGEAVTMADQLRPQPGSEGYADQARRWNAVQRVMELRAKALSEDPAAYVADKTGPITTNSLMDGSAPKIIRERLNWQSALGDVPSMRGLTRAEAGGLARSVSEASGPEAMADAIEQMRQGFGEAWPDAWSQIAREGKLPTEARLLGILDRPEDSVPRVDFARALSVSPQELRQAAGETASRDVREELDESLADMRSTLVAQGASVSTYNDLAAGAERLALYYVSRGESPKSASRKASDALFNSRYRYSVGTWKAEIPRDQRDRPEATAMATVNVSARIPRDVDVAALEERAVRAVRTLSIETLPDLGGGDPALTPGDRQAAALAAARGGTFVTNADDTGLVLLYPNFEPVILADGTLLEVPFAPPPEEARSVSEARVVRRQTPTSVLGPEPTSIRERYQAAIRRRNEATDRMYGADE